MATSLEPRFTSAESAWLSTNGQLELLDPEGVDDAAAGFLLPESPELPLLELLEPPSEDEDFEPEEDSLDEPDEDSVDEPDVSADFDAEGTLADSLARLSVR